MEWYRARRKTVQACLRFLKKQNKYSHQLDLLSYGKTIQSSSTPSRRLIYQSFGLSQLTLSPAHLHHAMRSLFSDFLSEENLSVSSTIMSDCATRLIFTAANICCWSVRGLEWTSYFGNRNCGECALCHFAVRIYPRFLLVCQANNHCCVCSYADLLLVRTFLLLASFVTLHKQIIE